MTKNITFLPNEIIFEIYSYLDLISQYKLSNTCTKFNILYSSKIIHKGFLYNCVNYEWIDFISYICKNTKYKIELNNKIDDDHILIIVSTNYIVLYDYYKKKNYKYTQIYDLIQYIKICNYGFIVFLTHKIKIPIYLNYNKLKKSEY